METLRKLLLTLFACILSIGFTLHSENPPTTGGSISIRGIKGDSIRKRLPSNFVLEITYENGMVSFWSKTEEEIFELTFENSESGVVEVIPSIAIGECVPLDLEIGQYEVSLQLLDGSICSGTMIIY